MNEGIAFEIKKHIGVLKRHENGWAKELNIVVWNGGAPKLDIRDWDSSHERMTKGVTLHASEGYELSLILNKFYEEHPEAQRVFKGDK